MSSPNQFKTTPRRYQLFIDGQFVDAESGKTFTSPNPRPARFLPKLRKATKPISTKPSPPREKLSKESGPGSVRASAGE